jgi:adenylate kinase
MKVILLGAPGSGKGSVGELVGEAYSLPKISTGDLLREAVRNKTPLGLQAETQMGKGGLVDDLLVLSLLKERLDNPDCRGGYILDGYPRNLDQAKSLEMIDASRREAAFEIQVSEETLIRRLSNRRICPSCEAVYNLATRKPLREGRCDRCEGPLVQRQDDHPEVISERLKTYHQKTEPLLSYFQERGVLHRIDGNGTVEEVFSLIRSFLDSELMKVEAGKAGP